VRTVLHDRSYGERAGEMRREMESLPPINEAVRLLEALADG